jgi:hypothetical protein
MYGCNKYWGLVEDIATHAYTRKLAGDEAEFFAAHLLNNKIIVIDEKGIEPIEPKKLWGTQSGYVRGEMAKAKFVFEENIDRLKQLQKRRSTQSVQQRMKRALRWLKQRVYKDRVPADLNPRIYYTDNVENMRMEAAFWFSHADIINSGISFRDYRHQGPLPVTIALWNDGTRSIAQHFDWIRHTCTEEKRVVLVIDVSGISGLEPNCQNGTPVRDGYGIIHKLSDDLVWLDDSLAALRTYDITRAIDALKYWPGLDGKSVNLYTCDRQGVYGELAAAVDSRIAKIEVCNGMGGYSSWIISRHYDSYDVRSLIIPGMLEYCDLPELKAWSRKRHK